MAYQCPHNSKMKGIPRMGAANSNMKKNKHNCVSGKLEFGAEGRDTGVKSLLSRKV